MPFDLPPRNPVRDQNIQVRVSAAEYAAVEEVARAHGSTIAAAVRALLADALARYRANSGPNH
jgi:hypothetical protein